MYDADEEVQFYREHPELLQDSGSEPQGGPPEEMYDADEEVQFYREHPELLDGILASEPDDLEPGSSAALLKATQSPSSSPQNTSNELQSAGSEIDGNEQQGNSEMFDAKKEIQFYKDQLTLQQGKVISDRQIVDETYDLSSPKESPHAPPSPIQECDDGFVTIDDANATCTQRAV